MSRTWALVGVVGLVVACGTTTTSTGTSGTGSVDSTGVPVITTTSTTIVTSTTSTEIATSTTSTTSTTAMTTTTVTVPVATVAPTQPPVTGPSTLVWQLPSAQRVAAITIDAGSDVGYTSQILDTLAAEGVHATFGITGTWAAANPEVVRRIAAEGHQVINHSYSHHSFTGVSAVNPLLTLAQRQADLARAEEILVGLTGASTKPFWRPPYGDSNESVLFDVGSVGYAYTVMWTVDSWGWRGLSADEIVDRVLELTEPGAILAFHVGSASQDFAALERIIDALRTDGYTFATIAQALE